MNIDTEPTSSAGAFPLLDATEARIVGCLIEKAAITPEVYPLTINAIVSACNQKTSRDPIMQLETGTVAHALRQLEERLVAADDQLAVWEVLWAGAREFGFCRVRLSLCGAVYSGGSESRSASSSDGHYREEEVSSASWSLRIPITDQDYVNLVREFQTEELPHGVAPLIEMLRRVLGQKAISLRDEQAPNLMDELSALGN